MPIQFKSSDEPEEHITGPWSINESGHGSMGSRYHIENDKQEFIGYVYECREVDVQLMITAPELLEALETIVTDMGGDGNYWDEINNLIRKAKGAE